LKDVDNKIVTLKKLGSAGATAAEKAEAVKKAKLSKE